MPFQPSEFASLSFDCYGTLIDWESGLIAALRPWAVQQGIRASDEDLLRAFAHAEPAAEQTTPKALYSDILADVMSRIAAAFHTNCADSDRRAFAASVGDWPAFSDTAEALTRLKRRCRLIILSNVDHRSLARTLPRLGVPFDAVVTAEDVGAYKPDQRMFDALLRTMDHLGLGAASHLHVAQSLYHDVAPAQAIGLRTCWVDRRSGRDGGATPAAPASAKPDMTVHALAELADWFDRGS